MPINAEINIRSILDLIASDFVYKPKAEITAGDILQTFPDNHPAHESSFPSSLATSLGGDPLGQLEFFEQNGVTGVKLPQWEVVRSFETARDGFGAVVFRSRARGADGKYDYIVAFRGTDGADPQDWFANLDLASTVWRDNSLEVISYLTSVQSIGNEIDRPSLNRIHFTGQSLGGAFAQYAAYDFALAVGSDNSDFYRDVTLTTFNSFGGVRGLQQLAGVDERPPIYDPSLLKDVVTAHFSIENDIVHRLGAGASPVADVGGSWHVNGLGNTYQFHFRRYVNGVPVVGPQNFLGIVEGHRIESGFYQGFQNHGGTFLSATPEKISYVDGENSRSVSAAWSRVGNRGFTTDLSAWTRVVVGGAAIAVAGDFKEINQAASALSEAWYKSGDTPVSAGATKAGILALVGVVKLLHKGVITGKIAGIAFALLLERRAELNPEEKTAAAQALNSFLPPNRRLDESAVVAGVSNTSASRNLRSDLASIIGMSFAETETEIAEFLTNPRHADLARELRGISKHPVNLAEALSGPNWLSDTLAELRLEAISSLMSNVDKERKFADFSLQIAVLINDIKRTTAQQDTIFLSSIGTTLQEFIRQIGGILSSLPIDVIYKNQSPQTELGVNTLRFQKYDEIRDIFAEAAQNLSNAGIGSALEDALETIESAGQTIVVAQGRPQNPFDDPEFDPDASAVAIGAIKEGQVKTFTVFVPYEAQEGGQHVSLQLGGSAAGSFKVLLAADEIDLGVDGEFDLLIDEDSRSISFGLWAQEDVDTDGTLSLSATLVDAEGNATHVTHLELNLALDAQDGAPPAGGREIRGDWGAKPFTDPVTGETFPARVDDLFNIERDPAVPNNGEWTEIDSLLGGSSGPDHIVTGEYEDQVHAYEGDDSITGGELHGTIILAGAGNDWIEALGYSSHAADYHEFEYLGRTIKLGEDKIHGGAGDDRIWGESQATEAALYDPATLPAGLPGDWSNGGSGADKIYGGAGDDVLMGGIGTDQLVGGAGRDVLLGDDDYLAQPEGNFWRVLHPNYGDATPGFGGFELGLFPVVNATLDRPDSVFRQTGDPDFTYYKNGGAADILIGGAGKDILIGQLGDDALYGGADDDILAGWEGADELLGGEGDDLMAGDFGRYEQVDQRVVDAVELVRAGVLGSPASHGSTVDQTGNDFLDGAAGNDTLFGEGGADVVLGGEGGDTLYGDATYLPDELHGADFLDGGAGNDALNGGGRNDQLYGGAGNDTLLGEAGNDLLDGGADDDSLSGGEGDDTLVGREGADSLLGGEGADRLSGDDGNDVLDGGGGDDVLLSGEGDDRLDGGAGNDALYSGSGADILSGGAGDDLIDAGGGIDIARGGEGNDTYAFGFGYGSDLIEDTEGANRIQFESGILPEQIAAEWAGSALTVAYGFSGETFTLDATQFQLGGIDFADGTSWTARDLINNAPRIVGEGSESADAVSGVLHGRNDLRGLGADDQITGADYDDLLAGGEGFDVLDGAGDSDRYFFTADETGVDQISDSELAGRAYLDWFYGNLGVTDWERRAEHGGSFEVFVEDDVERVTLYYGTFEEAFAHHPDATITYVEPLPEVAPVVTRNDTQTLDQLTSAEVLARDVVEFGPGLTLADLALTITVQAAVADQHPEQPWFGGGTLAVRWADAGFDLEVPDVNYGFVGTNLMTDGANGGNGDTGAWRGYRLGEGVEAFEFADDATYTLEEVLQQATVIAVSEPYHFFRGSGSQLISRNVEAIAFEDFIRSFEVAISRDGADLLLTLDDGSQGRIAGWYADPLRLPSMSLRFAFEPEMDAQLVTELGLTVTGTDEADHLQGLDRFRDRLIGLSGDDVLEGGGGNDYLQGDEGADTLDGGAGHDELFGNADDDLLAGGPGEDYLVGGAGLDAYVLEPGGGRDTIDNPFFEFEPSTEDVIRLPEGIGPQDVVITRTFSDLSVWIRGTGDRIEVKQWFLFPEKRLAGIEFFDGTLLDADTMEMRIEPAPGTDEDDEIFGSSEADSIDGLGGNDQIIAGEGDDSVEGGTGDDVLVGNAGRDILRGGEGNDGLEDCEGGTLFDAGPGADFIYHEGHSFIMGGAGADWIDTWGPDSVIAFNAGDGQDMIYAAAAFTLSLGGGVAPSDLSLSQDGSDLVLSIGPAEGVRLSRESEPDREAWPVITLQLFGSVHTYDFNAVIDAFHEALAQDPALDRFPLRDVLPALESSFSETDAVGGVLAHQYATTGTIDSLADAEIREVLGDPRFGAAAQPIEAGAGNQRPVVTTAVTDQDATEDSEFSFAVPADIFSDPGDVLTLSATLADGTGLPSWLGFDATSNVFHGTPANENVGTFDVTVTATDTDGLSASDTFQLTVANVNDAPKRDNLIADQSATVGTPFSFTPAADTFGDIDLGDTLAYSATLENGDPLPAWLAFESAERAFAGTPDATDVGELSILVTATDLAGSAATDKFQLTVADEDECHGVYLVGTDDDDTLTGTECDDELEGLKGRDQLMGLDGDDLLMGGRGRDRLFGDDGQDALYGERGRDVLYGGAGDDLLDGGKGHDRLEGGEGNDVYFHEQRGGHDSIEEQGSGLDALLFGEGITPQMARLERRHDDLVVDLAGGNGSVTIDAWFASDSRKVESIHFADGTTWGVEEIRDRARRKRHGGGLQEVHHHGQHHSDHDDGHGKGDGRERNDRDGDRSEQKRGSVPDLLAAYFADKPRYDFETFAHELETSDPGEGLGPRETARRWQLIARYEAGLANEQNDDARSGAVLLFHGRGLLGGGAFGGAFGHAGSTGATRGPTNLQKFFGLEEGFQRLVS